ncbi:hypothetical protein JCM19233_700 [Vibrio astriarenae]|nr:hypothetical protein JCM19233_700 [Vibrio sp. C7]
MNLAILKDLRSTFTHFNIDLRTIKTETNILVDEARLIELFASLLKGECDEQAVIDVLLNTTNKQYEKGVS